MQESGQENLFIFGEEASEIARLREERKDFKDYDPRFLTAIKMIKDGVFGDKEYFQVIPASECLSPSFPSSPSPSCSQLVTSTRAWHQGSHQRAELAVQES